MLVATKHAVSPEMPIAGTPAWIRLLTGGTWTRSSGDIVEPTHEIVDVTAPSSNTEETAWDPITLLRVGGRFSAYCGLQELTDR